MLELKLDPIQVTIKLFELVENPASSSLTRLASEIGIPEDNLHARERFFREIKELLRLIPEKAYLNPDDRATLQNNCQMELDAITNQLEELEGPDDESNIDFQEPPTSQS